jgi:hypothetical protein
MGDRAKAREEVETALGIDPDFLAARLLREQLDTEATSTVLPPASEPVTMPAPAPAVPSLAASAAKLAELENKVKERVRHREAAVAHPVVPPRSKASHVYRWGALTAAAAAFGIVISGSAVQKPPVLPARSHVAVATLMESYSPDPLDTAVLAADVNAEDEVPAPIVERRAAPMRVGSVAATPILAPSPAPIVAPVPAPTTPANTVVTDSPPPAFVPRTIDDKTLVEETLSRYRRAYNRLDARSAQAVYPAVNGSALARAFDGLQSQSLVFDECDIDVRGGQATVTCRGTSRYVPKIGNRDTRTESRVWDFTLRKAEGDWKIENARASR